MSEQSLNILITGGGTGGHVYPALATLEALERQIPLNVVYVGTRKGIEARLVPQQGIPYRTIWIAGFQRRWTWKNVLFPFKLLVSLWQSWRILRQVTPRVAVGTGGYVTGPVLWMAARMGIPVVIEEQDVFPGITTRLLAPHATKICLAFEGARKYLKVPADKIVVTGNPVRQQLATVAPQAARQHWGLPPEAPVVLVFGGSQGARAINLAVEQCIEEWTRQGIHVIWQTGPQDFERVQQKRSKWPETVKILPYIDEMGMAYQAADVVVCRAGAITLAELALVQKPAVLIPYPFAAGDHQLKNARFVEEQGAAITLTQDDKLAERLNRTVQQLLADDARRKAMQEAWKPLAHPDAADKIAAVILAAAGMAASKTATSGPLPSREEKVLK